MRTAWISTSIGGRRGRQSRAHGETLACYVGVVRSQIPSSGPKVRALPPPQRTCSGESRSSLRSEPGSGTAGVLLCPADQKSEWAARLVILGDLLVVYCIGVRSQGRFSAIASSFAEGRSNGHGRVASSKLEEMTPFAPILDASSFALSTSRSLLTKLPLPSALISATRLNEQGTTLLSR